MDRQKITLPFEDLGCAGSGATVVEQALARVPGVLRVYVNAAMEMAYVQYDTDRCNIDTLREAVAHAGFHIGAIDRVVESPHSSRTFRDTSGTFNAARSEGRPM